MNIILFYIVSVILSVNQTAPLVKTKTYQFDYISDKDEKLSDYIQLVFQKDSVVKGIYYGNEDGIHFVADIKFDKKTQNDIFSFSLINYEFCNENSNPFDKIRYSEIKKLPINLENGVNFSGSISDKQLVLRRTLWHYDSRFDNMIFNLTVAN